MDSRQLHTGSENLRIAKYYQYHSHIYDATRWSFLFGRKDILNVVPALLARPHILEIGCGTGQNLVRLHRRFPHAQITGIDLSPDMLDKARARFPASDYIRLKQGVFGSDPLEPEHFDLILLSYSLTMFANPGLSVLNQISRHLEEDGYIAVVDFHTSPFGWFRRWMNMNHVDFSGNLLPKLRAQFQTVSCSLRKAYLGMWSYYLYIGQKK